MPPAIEESCPTSTTVEIAPGSSAGAWAIEVQDETGARRLALAGERVTVGSSPSADVVVHDPTVSARHCAFAAAGATVAIEDLGSRNGTYVGGARVREAWAQAGTAVIVGRSTLIVERADPSDANDPPGDPLPGIAGASLAMRRVADQVRRLARHSLPVLIAGESGSGKELIARAIHCEGPRRSRPFVAVNVTALPREL